MRRARIRRVKDSSTPHRKCSDAPLRMTNTLFMELTLSYAQAQDRADPLASFRDEFVIDDAALIYMDGNSLGRLPKRAQARLSYAVAEEWGERLVRGWNEGWYDAPQRIGAKIAQII